MPRKPKMPVLPPAVKEFFAAQGRIGGALGGKARAKNLTKKRLKEIARLAATARWARPATKLSKERNVEIARLAATARWDRYRAKKRGGA